MIPGFKAPQAQVTEDDADLLTRAEASDFLATHRIQMKPATLARLWSVGFDGPPCVHIRHKPYYPRGMLREWAAAQISDPRTRAPAAAQARGRRNS